MKKKETPKQKPKEFAASPFQGLKGVALGTRESAPAPAPVVAPFFFMVPPAEACRSRLAGIHQDRIVHYVPLAMPC